MKICVGISVYGQPLSWLQESVNSVRNQSIDNWNLIIRIDGIETLDASCLAWILEQEKNDSRIIVDTGKSRLGEYASYREIFNDLECDYILQLDADDRLKLNALEVALEVIDRQPEVPFVYSQALIIDSKGEENGLDGRSLVQWKPNIDLVQFIYFHLRLVRYSAYVQVGGYNPKYLFAGDYDLSLRLAELGRPAHIPQPLYEYRVHSKSASQTEGRNTHLESCMVSRLAIERRSLKSFYRLNQCPSNESFVLETRKPRQIAITGMHRSGTSLLSSLLIKLGVDFGDNFIPSNDDQPRGYFEDSQLVALHRRWFSRVLEAIPNGWHDWGWNPSRSLSCLGLWNWEIEAQGWLSSRQSSYILRNKSYYTEGWGWKDPRTTLLIPFWQKCCPTLKIIGIYRTPWDLSDALQRLTYPFFRLHPECIIPIWQLYNERLVEFAEARPESCIILHAESLAKEPQRLLEILVERWDWDSSPFSEQQWQEDIVDPSRLPCLLGDDPISKLYEIVYPDLAAILIRLQICADLPQLDLACPHDPGLLRHTRPTNPTITVIIPTFNPSHWLLEAIASVHRFCQDTSLVEIIIVNDGSTNVRSLLLLSRLQNAGYPVFHQENKGPAAARNQGIKHARSSLILPLDDDNRLLDPYLFDAVQIMNANESLAFLYGDRVDFGARQQLFCPGPNAINELLHINRIDSCAIIRKSLWAEVGGYDETLNALEDWDFWLSASRIGAHACYLPRPCFEYRVRENSMLRKHLRDATQHKSTIEYLARKHGVHIEAMQ
jgi:glycosyltransferase involved in cell wall biosynthesis